MDSGYPSQPPPTEYAPAPQNLKNEDSPPVVPQHDYGYTPIPAPQKQSSNVVVVNSQPTPAVVATVRRVGDHYLTLSILLTILCFICGAWHALLCTIPAIIFSTIARDAEARGDIDSAQTNSHLSLGCNIGGLFSNVVGFVILIIVVIVVNTTTASTPGTCSHHYNYHYSSYSYSCYK